MPYQKGNHCNNNCANAIFDSVTVYEGYQFGQPVDHEKSVIYCADRPKKEYSRPVYNCPIYRAANTACTPTNGGASEADNSSTPAAIRG